MISSKAKYNMAGINGAGRGGADLNAQFEELKPARDYPII